MVAPLSPSDAALVADVLDETLAAASGPPSPLHARLMDIRDRLRATPNGPSCQICGDERILMEHDGSKAQPCYACTAPGTTLEQASRPYAAAAVRDMDQSLDRAATTMSMIDQATGQGRR